MTGGGWQLSHCGVMLFVPAENDIHGVDRPPSVEHALSRLPISPEPPHGTKREEPSSAVRPSLDSLSLNIMRRPRSDSPSTFGRDEPVVLYTPTSSGLESDGDAEDDPYISISPSVISGYESDRTDFLIDDDDGATPCPKRTAYTVHQGVSGGGLSLKDDGVVRLLDFGQKARQETPKVKRSPHEKSNGQGALDKLKNLETPHEKSNDQRALDKLKNLEKSPRHSWTDRQRHLLCIIFRFYENSTPDASDLVKVWNTMNGLELPVRKVKDQMLNHIRLYGARCYPYYGKTFGTPLNDPDGEYLAVRISIEEAAESVGIHLQRRTRDDVTPSGRAANAKAPSTRRYFKKLVRKAQFVNDAPLIHKASLRTSNAAATLRLGGFAISTVQGTDEFEVDEGEGEGEGESESKAAVAATKGDVTRGYGPHQLSHLAFRVWDANSRTVWDEERGFIAEAHSIWNGPLLPPPNPRSEDGRNTILFLSNLHLSKKGNASAFVSVATSLIWVLNIASTMKDPHFATVDLSHPLLQGPAHKKLQASSYLTDLKAIGQAQWARYKGLAEVMVWADIPKYAILHHDLYTKIKAVLAAEPALYFKDFQSVGRLKKHFLSRSITLNNSIARTMGVLGKVIGLDRVQVKTEHISEYVTVFVDGWGIVWTQNEDIHTRSSVATSFALALDSPHMRVQDVIQTFLDGLERGLENIEYWHHRRRLSVQQRHTT